MARPLGDEEPGQRAQSPVEDAEASPTSSAISSADCIMLQTILMQPMAQAMDARAGRPSMQVSQRSKWRHSARMRWRPMREETTTP